MSEDAGGIESGYKSKLPSIDRRMATLGILALVLIATVAAAFTGAFQGVDKIAPQNGDKTSEDVTNENKSGNLTYASANESTTHDVSKQESQNVDVAVTILPQGVSPSRYSTKIGEPVKFYNNNSFTVRLEFDRSDATPKISGGSTYTTSFNGITYYSVYNANTGDLVGKGSIYVE